MNKVLIIGRIVVWLLSFSIIGCKTTKQPKVVSENVKVATTDNNREKSIVRDSVRIVDSVVVEYKRGFVDTMVIRQYRDKYQTSIKHDTIAVVRVDTLIKTRNVVEQSKKQSPDGFVSAIFAFLGGCMIAILFYKTKLFRG